MIYDPARFTPWGTERLPDIETMRAGKLHAKLGNHMFADPSRAHGTDFPVYVCVEYQGAEQIAFRLLNAELVRDERGDYWRLEVRPVG